MKILVLAPQPFYQDRGTPIAVRLLASALVEQGHEVHILTFHEGEAVDLPRVKVHRIPAVPGLSGLRPGPSWKKYACDVLLFFACFRMVRFGGFDLIHAVEESVFIALAMKVFFGIPFIYDMDSSLADQMLEKYSTLRPFEKQFKFFEKVAVRKSDGVMAVCKYLEELAMGVDPDKLVTRLEDISLLSVDFGNGDLAHEKIPVDAPVILYVGNLESHQGIDLLLESFRLVAREDSKAELVIVGGNREGILRYRKKAEELGIGTRTHFIGPRSVSRLHSLLCQAEVLVSPRIEGKNTPMKIYSYLDSGRPLVATRLPTHTQVLDDSIAVLADPEPAPFAQGILKVLNDKELAARLALRAKQRVEEKFSYDIFQKKIEEFYTLLEKRLVAR